MGRQYGVLMKDELQAEYEMFRSRFTANGYTEAEVRELAREITSLQAKRIQEIQTGIAELSGMHDQRNQHEHDSPGINTTVSMKKRVDLSNQNPRPHSRQTVPGCSSDCCTAGSSYCAGTGRGCSVRLPVNR